MQSLNELLKLVVERHASDLHLKAMRPPLLRIDKGLVPAGDALLTPEQIEEMVRSILTPKHAKQLDEQLWVDLGYSLTGVSRFRVSVTHQRSSLGAVFRRIPFQFPSLDDWELPNVIKEFSSLQDGMVLVTGPTGSGKSSTLAALLRLICDTRPVHIVTIEDPIEFLITDSQGAISQREVGTDTLSFRDALRNVLRQDPDVITIGEMRDLETMATAITAAETGHLVFSTLHTNSAAQTVDRILDAFPSKQQVQIRAQLSHVLRGIISLKLVPRKDSAGLVAAVEILRNNPRVAKLIEDGNITELDAEIEQSVTYFKMQSMNQSLMALVLNGAVSIEVAQEAAPRPGEFDRDMRKFLLAAGAAPKEGDPMAESQADYSKIVGIQELKRLYDEAQERHKAEILEKDRFIVDLQEDLRTREAEIQTISDSVNRAQDEAERIKREAMQMKMDLEAKLAKALGRLKDVQTVPKLDPAASAARKGFFSR